MEKFIFVVSQPLADFLFANDIDCLSEQEIDNCIVYIFPNSNDLVRLINSKYSKKDYYFGNRMYF